MHVSWRKLGVIEVGVSSYGSRDLFIMDEFILNGFKIKYEAPMKLLCTNKSAISIAHNSVWHDKTKHIEIDRHFIKEKLDSWLIATTYIIRGHFN